MAKIQDTGLLEDAGNTTSTVAFNAWAGANFTPGSAVLIQFSAAGTIAGAVTGVTVSGTAATIVSAVQNSSNGAYWDYIAFAQNIAGGNKTVGFTYGSVTATYLEAIVTEYTASHFVASAFDVQATVAVNTGSAVATTAAKSQANELVAVVCGSTGIFSGSGTITGMVGYTQNAVQNTAGKIGHLSGLNTVSAGGTESVTFTSSSGSLTLNGCIATFKLATATAPAPTGWKKLQLSAIFSAVLIAFPPAPSPYFYVDPANPTFETTWGSGNNSTTKRTILAPQHKRVIIDGTTSSNGNYYHVANLAAAKNLAFTPGDWWLLPGGGTTTGATGEFVCAGAVGIKGVSRTDMFVLGTFDPADKENDAKYNTLRHTFDMTGSGVDAQVMYCNRAVAMQFVSFQNLTFKATDNEAGCNVTFGIQPGFSDWLVENCIFDHVTTSFEGLRWVSGTMASQPAGNSFNNLTWKLSTWSYASGSQGGHQGNRYHDMVRNMRSERCLNYHGGWGNTITRSIVGFGDPGAPTTLGCGPDLFKHGDYNGDACDQMKYFDCVFGWDSCNLKLVGGNYWMQNIVSIREPISLIWAPCGNNSGFATFPAGSIFQSTYHLIVESDECNISTSPQYRGWGPYIVGAIAGSYYDKALWVNQNPPDGRNKQGFNIQSNGTYAQTCAVTNGVFAGVIPQDLSLVANVTKVFTSNRWDEASNGSNVQWSTLSPQMQALRTALIARNVYATFATEQGIVVSQAGGNPAIELRVLDYLRDNWASKDWCLALQTHFRSALA